MTVTMKRGGNSALYDTSIPVLLTPKEQKLLQTYQIRLEDSRTAAEARIYSRKIENLISVGKRRNPRVR